MRKVMKKLNILLLSLAVCLSFVVPAAAAVTPSAPTTGTRLLLHYLPLGEVPQTSDGQGVTLSVYRVAQPNANNAEYELADGYNGANLEALVSALNDSLFFSDDPKQEKYGSAYSYPIGSAFGAFDYSTVRDWISAFGGYINNGSEGSEGKNETAPLASGQTNSKGEVLFQNLPDGIYLVASNNSYKFAGSDDLYVAAPFIIQLPYVDAAGNANNWVSANMKWFTLESNTTNTDVTPDDPPPTPPADDPDGPDDPVTPPTPPTPPDVPDDPTPPVDDPTPPDPTTPVEPDVPVTPDTPDDTVNIEDEDVPLGEPEIELLDEDVPLGELPEELDPEIEIPDEDVPLAMLPQTGLLWWPVPVMAVAGLLLIVIGLISKKRGERDA
jgi:hypothetical protein